MANCFRCNGEGNYLIGIGFWWNFQRVQVAQGRCFQGILMFQKAWRMLGEGFWMVKWGWSCLKLKNKNFVLKDESWVCSRGFLSLQAWFLHGTPSLFIGKIFDWFGGENGGVSSKKGKAQKTTKCETCWTRVDELDLLIPFNSVCYAPCIHLLRHKWSQNMLMWFLLFASLVKIDFWLWFDLAPCDLFSISIGLQICLVMFAEIFRTK